MSQRGSKTRGEVLLFVSGMYSEVYICCMKILNEKDHDS